MISFHSHERRFIKRDQIPDTYYVLEFVILTLNLPSHSPEMTWPLNTGGDSCCWLSDEGEAVTKSTYRSDRMKARCRAH